MDFGPVHHQPQHDEPAFAVVECVGNRVEDPGTDDEYVPATMWTTLTMGVRISDVVNVDKDIPLTRMPEMTDPSPAVRSKER